MAQTKLLEFSIPVNRTDDLLRFEVLKQTETKIGIGELVSGIQSSDLSGYMIGSDMFRRSVDRLMSVGTVTYKSWIHTLFLDQFHHVIGE